MILSTADWEESPSSRLLGGKARALAELDAAGFQVPEWFVLLPEAFEQSLTLEQRTALSSAQNATEIQAAVAEIKCCQDVAAQLCAAARKLGGADAVLAVRSSALSEDSARFSFAGQLESYLFVSPQQLCERVADVWRSGFSRRLMAYRVKQGLPLMPDAPAVLVQRMIDAAKSGIAFSASPVSGRRRIVVVSATYGLGTALVSGAAEGDTYEVGDDGQIVSRAIANKRFAHRRGAAGPEGVESVPVEAECALQPALSDGEVQRVAELAGAAERFFQRPQDIEWAIDASNELWLLQSRPITNLADLPDPDGPRSLWDNSNITESYPGISSPLTFSFARRAYEEVYRQFSLVMGVAPEVVADEGNMYRHMLGYVRGRVYYNLLNWYRLLAMLPGFRTNRRFMETMMGVRQALPEEVVAALSKTRTSFRDRWRTATAAAGLLANYFHLDREVRGFFSLLDDCLHTNPDFSRWRPDQLVAHYRDLERRLLVRWKAPIINDFFAMVFYGLLQKLSKLWCGDATGTLQNDLLSARSGVISIDPAHRMHEMAAVAAQDAALLAALKNGNRRRAERAIAANPAFAQLFSSYLEKFGDRCMEELKLESATLSEDPSSLLRSVANLAASPAPSSCQRPERRASEEAEARVSSHLKRHPLQRGLFRWVLRNARRSVGYRENLRFERTRVFGRVRRIFVELGRRLYALDRIDDPRDVFFLEVEEILGFVEGTCTSTDLRALVNLRRAESVQYHSEAAPPDRFETRGPVAQSVPVAGEIKPEREAPTAKGIGCCPGTARGRACVVRDPKSCHLHFGEVLVAERTDPGWVTLFPLAAGLLVERGSLLSHSAIIARELGLPTVVSVPGVTRWLHDGDLVELDGATGEVHRLQSVTQEAP